MTLLDTRTNRRGLIYGLLGRLADAAPVEDGSTGAPLYLDDEVNLDYALAVTDLLDWLGAVQLHEHTLAVCVTSAQAGYLLRLLSDLLASNANLVADWRREEPTPRGELLHPFGAATDLLGALELRRLELLPDAAPVREIEAATGLIVRRDESGARAYLLVWNATTRAWQLPGGHCDLRDGSPSATLLRELREQLGLDTVVLLDDVSLAELGCPLAEVWLSPTYGLLTRTVFHSYVVRLRRELLLVATVCWLSETEVLAGRTSDGQTVSTGPLMQLLTHYGDELDMMLLENQRWSEVRLAA